MDTKICPNGCGELETAQGRIDTANGDTYFDVNIVYCPECMYIADHDISL